MVLKTIFVQKFEFSKPSFIKATFSESPRHCNDVIMGAVASQITSLTIVYSSVYSGADQRKHQSSASLAFVRGIHRSPVNAPHKGPVTRRKMFPFGDVIMCLCAHVLTWYTCDLGREKASSTLKWLCARFAFKCRPPFSHFHCDYSVGPGKSCTTIPQRYLVKPPWKINGKLTTSIQDDAVTTTKQNKAKISFSDILGNTEEPCLLYAKGWQWNWRLT